VADDTVGTSLQPTTYTTTSTTLHFAALDATYVDFNIRWRVLLFTQLGTLGRD
jgi:hypothetical protein